MLNLGVILGLVLLSALTTLVVATTRPRHTHFPALGGMVVVSFSWLVVRPSLPLTLAMGSQTSMWPIWSWRAGAANWSISMAVMLLSLGALALAARGDQGADRADTLFIQLLAVAALLACWADSLATHVLTWTLLTIVWVLGAAAPMDTGKKRPAMLSRRAASAFAAVLLLWLAATSAGPDADISGIAAWPTLTRTFVLVAATYQLGVFWFHRWRAVDGGRLDVRLALLHAAPAAAGAVLLARLEASSQIGLAFALPFTLLGLWALLVGAYRVWLALNGETAMAVGLIQAQTGLVLLAGVWVGPQAVVAETLVLLLGGGILLLDMGRERIPLRFLLPQPGAVIAAAALAALPLTAGFAGRSALYGVWLEEGRSLLVIVTALLHVPLLAALLAAYAPADRPAADTPENVHTPLDVARVLALLLPALGLLSVAALAQASAAVWLAILLPALVAVVFTWRLSEPLELSRTLREAISLPSTPTGLSISSVWRVAAALTSAARGALLLLEGEGGLLWMLLFVIILYFV